MPRVFLLICQGCILAVVWCYGDCSFLFGCIPYYGLQVRVSSVLELPRMPFPIQVCLQHFESFIGLLWSALLLLSLLLPFFVILLLSAFQQSCIHFPSRDGNAFAYKWGIQRDDNNVTSIQAGYHSIDK